MRYLGLDLGTKTLGISISDITATIATPYKTVRFDENNTQILFEELAKIVAEEKIGKIILGFPKNMNNTVGPRGEETITFSENLKERLGIEVVLEDERLTTVLAHNYMIEADMSRKKRKKKIDSLAANIILQTYLNKERGKENER